MEIVKREFVRTVGNRSVREPDIVTNAGRPGEGKPIGRMLESGVEIERLLKAIGVLYGALDMKKAVSSPGPTGTSGYMVGRDNGKH